MNKGVSGILKKILIILGGGRTKGNTAQLVEAFIERFYCIAEKDETLLLGWYEKYPIHDCALLMTFADDFFWTFEQAVSYLKEAFEFGKSIYASLFS